LANKKQKPRREFTKRQLSQWQRQKRRQRLILILGISIIVAVLGVVGAGWYIKEYRPLHQTVIKVNDTEFDMDYYIKVLKYRGEGQSEQYMQFLASQVVTVIERSELIKQGAMELGFTVTDEEVDEELNTYNPPLSKDYRDLVRAELLTNKLHDEYFEHKVPLSAEQRYIMVMFLESKSQAEEIRTRIEDGESFTELAGEFSMDNLSKGQDGDLGWRPEDVLAMQLNTSLVGEYAFSSEKGTVSPPIYDEAKFKEVGYWLIEVLERKEEPKEAHVQVILLGNDEEAEDIRARLEAGEEFSALAQEFSQHDGSKDSGGDLGWLPPDTMSPALDEFVFNGELETLSEPIRDDMVITEGGYWLVMVSDIDSDREIEDEDRNLMKSKLFDEWLSSVWDNSEVDDSYLDDAKKLWAIEKVKETI